MPGEGISACIGYVFRVHPSADGLAVVWLKRDLRISDHAPLRAAARHERVIVLYVYEPEIVLADDFDRAHLLLANDALRDLDAALRERGGRIAYRVGRLPEVFAALHRQTPIAALYAHEETGNARSYARDRRVRAWAKSAGVAVRETPRDGVFRRRETRDTWNRRWEARMAAPPLAVPERVSTPCEVVAEGPRDAEALGLAPSWARVDLQRGGEREAQAVLASFLGVRGTYYRSAMSSPLSGRTGCSRLSPYLATGAISLRTVLHAARARARAARADSTANALAHATSLRSFEARLHWHDHFIQKLEDEPELETRNISRAYDGLREPEFDDARFAAWCAGRTGYPMIDAVMRALVATGWTTFRMRAMLVSFASYHLWLHWREPGLHLARAFADYEPGIHWAQSQMQSGTTGINAMRVYSPRKQLRDQDPQGAFVRRWVPELARVPLVYLDAPETMPIDLQREIGCVVGRDYPAPIVDERVALPLAKARVAELRRRASTQAEAREIVRKHGSRKPTPPRSKRAHAMQPSLFAVDESEPSGGSEKKKPASNLDNGAAIGDGARPEGLWGSSTVLSGRQGEPGKRSP